MTNDCRVFRESYRRIKGDMGKGSVRRRHRDFYFYARVLFEAIEFFGQAMEESLSVFHGLKVKLLFENFSAYFNQPISTTTVYTIGTVSLSVTVIHHTVVVRSAHQLSGRRGIILKLKAAANVLGQRETIGKPTQADAEGYQRRQHATDWPSSRSTS